ncbi:hypothetical protein BOX15_Mlig029872g1, partial [Macrostomum lignano]
IRLTAQSLRRFFRLRPDRTGKFDSNLNSTTRQHRAMSASAQLILRFALPLLLLAFAAGPQLAGSATVPPDQISIQQCSDNLVKIVHFVCRNRGGIYDQRSDYLEQAARFLKRGKQLETAAAVAKRQRSLSSLACMIEDAENIVSSCCCRECSLSYLYGFCAYPEPVGRVTN